MNYKVTAALVGTLLLPLAALAQNITTVNGKPVPKARVDALVKAATHGQAATPDMLVQARDQVVLREIFAQEADREGLQKTPEYQQQLDLVRQTVLINTLFDNFRKAHPVTDEQARAEYDKVKAQQSGLEYHARHILVDNEDEAKKLIAQIKAGAKFEDVAKASSKDTESAKNGGDLDWARPAQTFVPEFATAVEKLKPGEMTDAPVKTQFGYHIIKLDETRPLQFPSFDDVKDKVKQQLAQIQLQEFQEKLRKSARTDYKFANEQAPGAVPAHGQAPSTAN